MKCPKCERKCVRRKWGWKCRECDQEFSLGYRHSLTQERLDLKPKPKRRKSVSNQERAPRASQFREGDVWHDMYGRPHLVEPCVRPELAVLQPLEHELAPIAVDRSRPGPWVRVMWGGME